MRVYLGSPNSWGKLNFKYSFSYWNYTGRGPFKWKMRFTVFVVDCGIPIIGSWMSTQSILRYPFSFFYGFNFRVDVKCNSYMEKYQYVVAIFIRQLHLHLKNTWYIMWFGWLIPRSENHWVYAVSCMIKLSHSACVKHVDICIWFLYISKNIRIYWHKNK